MKYVMWIVTSTVLASILTVHADTRIFGGTIHTLDADNPNPDALCVGTDGRFKALAATWVAKQFGACQGPVTL
jgi:predicted amidohydrolase YtcJ